METEEIMSSARFKRNGYIRRILMPNLSEVSFHRTSPVAGSCWYTAKEVTGQGGSSKVSINSPGFSFSAFHGCEKYEEKKEFLSSSKDSLSYQHFKTSIANKLRQNQNHHMSQGKGRYTPSLSLSCLKSSSIMAFRSILCPHRGTGVT